MTSHRIERDALIDRAKPLSFRFDGKTYQGFVGDTLASALLANGVRILGRSFKYHRPRGVWGAWVDDPNAIMTVTLNGRTLPNCPAATTMLADGMEARAVNAWPSAARDIKGVLDLAHPWLGAGFYYKTFMWPNWHLFEPMIRKMAGLGDISRDAPKDYVADQVFDHCEVLVIGGGGAGLAAARSAAEAGRNVVLVDDHPELGGRLHQMRAVEGQCPLDWIAEQAAAIAAAGGRILRATTAFGVYDHRMVGLAENGPFGAPPRLHRMRAERIVLASGALDRPVTFADNDRPGVMSLDAALEYLARYAVLAGKRIALVSDPVSAEAASQTLTEAGAREVIKLDPADGPVRALGRKALSGIAQSAVRHDVDTILASGGRTPLVHLWCHAGGKLDWCDTRQAFLPGTPPDGMIAIGAARGTYDLDAALAEARAVGAGRPVPVDTTTIQSTPPNWPRPGAKGRQWIDFQHDVTLKDVELAARENYASIEHLKRYTTLGMASDQGKTSNMAGLSAMAALQGRPVPEVGTTTFRPPFVPVPVGMYHGHHSKQLWSPLKRLALEPEHRSAGAALGEYGGWLRPGWYGPDDAATAIPREVVTARSAAGILDASPLGKIEVMGPDAAAFVDFVFYNTLSTLKTGALRYAFMLTEGGIVMDDGVVARLGPDRFVISCSSSHVERVRLHLEAWRQDGNDPDRVFVHDLTQHWATIAVTGPKARDIVAAVLPGTDLSAAAFPHMTLKIVTHNDTPLRVARVSFTGDTSFELSIRRSKAATLWSALTDAGGRHGAAPIGVEALSILRAEKGYIIVGKDTDGETMPHDLGFGIPRRKKKTAFVGDRSLHTEKANAPDRKVLVGLEPVDGEASVLPTGAHMVEGTPPRSLGYVTSSYHSPTLGRPIALGLLEGGTARMGSRVTIWHLGKTRTARVVAPCALDPEGRLLDA